MIFLCPYCVPFPICSYFAVPKMSGKPKLKFPPRLKAESFESVTVSLSPYLRKSAQRPPRKTESDMILQSIESDTDSLSPFLNNRPEQIRLRQALREEKKWGKRAQKIRVKRLAKFYCHHQTRQNPFLAKKAISCKVSHSKLWEKRTTMKSKSISYQCPTPSTSNWKIHRNICLSLGLLAAVVLYILIGAIFHKSLQIQTNKSARSVSTNITHKIITENNLTHILPQYRTRCRSVVKSPITRPNFWRSTQRAVMLIGTVRPPGGLPDSIPGRMFVVLYFVPGIFLLLSFLVNFVILVQETLDRFVNFFTQNSDPENCITFTGHFLRLFLSLLPTFTLISLLAIALYLQDSSFDLTTAIHYQIFMICTVGLPDIKMFDDNLMTVANAFSLLLGLGLLLNILQSSILAFRAARNALCFCMYENTGHEESRYSTEVQPGSLNRTMIDNDEL